MAFRIEELSGSLIKSGRFKDSIEPFFLELEQAWENGVITVNELRVLERSFAHLLLVPNAEDARLLGEKMLTLHMRILSIKQPFDDEAFEANVKASREAD